MNLIFLEKNRLLLALVTVNKMVLKFTLKDMNQEKNFGIQYGNLEKNLIFLLAVLI